MPTNKQGCPKCGRHYRFNSIKVVIEQYNTYDQLWYVCKYCDTKAKRAFRHNPKGDRDYAPRCPVNFLSEQEVDVS